MTGPSIESILETPIVQVIGVAYTFRPSLMVRRHLTRNLAAYHSAQNDTFSYFYKGDSSSIVSDGEDLTLRKDPITGALVQHWPEPELAVLLGNNHEFIAYTLANDLTAIGVETRGRTKLQDNTFFGKVWAGSGSLGPRFVAASMIRNPEQLVIGLSIKRGGKTILNQQYNTARRSLSFNSIPSAIVVCYRKFEDRVPQSKQICLSPSGELPAGTVIMLGTGLIVRREYYCRPGDVLTVYSPDIGELTNLVTSEGSEAPQYRAHHVRETE
ncbi:MAG TPA: fumarylacetoacetate hydrolase family protein [Pyrinomonadaceae bacterium]